MRAVGSEATHIDLQQSFRNRVRHPPCIRHLLRHGVPTDKGWEWACILLARYLVSKGLNDVQGARMAKTMLKQSDTLGEGVADGSAFTQFGETLSRTRENAQINSWRCEDVWSSKQLRERGVCTAWSCEYYHLGSYNKSDRRIGETEGCEEEQALTYLLNNPDSVTGGLETSLCCEGYVDEYECKDGTLIPFNRVLWHVCRHLAQHGRPVRSTVILTSLSQSPAMRTHIDELEQYLRWLQSRPSCYYDRFIEYLRAIEARGGRMRAQELINQAAIALASTPLPLDVILGNLEHQSRILSSKANDKHRLFEQDLNNFATNLFSSTCGLIPTRSDWLNVCLEGGWKPGRTYVVTTSSTVETTDFCAWCAEFAAQRRFPTLFLSGVIGKDDFTERALSRQCGINAKEISRYRNNGFCSDEGTILERVVEAGDTLSRRIAPYFVMIEARSEMTASDLRNAIRTGRDRIAVDRDLPTLLILDQIPVQPPDSGGISESVQKSVHLEENSLLKGVKSEMRRSAMAIIAAFSKAETTKKARLEQRNTLPLHRDVKRLLDADFTLTIQSAPIKVRGIRLEKDANQLDLSRKWYERSYPRFRGHIDRLFDEVEGVNHVDEATSRYARISLFEKGRNPLANPAIIYEWLYHRFKTLNLEPTGLEKFRNPAFDNNMLGVE